MEWYRPKGNDDFIGGSLNYRISSNNSLPSNNRFPPPPLPPPTHITGFPIGISIAVNLEDEPKVESDPAKLISDDSSCDAEDTDIEN